MLLGERDVARTAAVLAVVQHAVAEPECGLVDDQPRMHVEPDAAVQRYAGRRLPDRRLAIDNDLVGVLDGR